MRSVGTLVPGADALPLIFFTPTTHPSPSFQLSFWPSTNYPRSAVTSFLLPLTVCALGLCPVFA